MVSKLFIGHSALGTRSFPFPILVIEIPIFIITIPFSYYPVIDLTYKVKVKITWYVNLFQL